MYLKDLPTLYDMITGQVSNQKKKILKQDLLWT